MIGLMVVWTAVQGDWTVNLTGTPLWHYSATTAWGGLVPYAYTYATSRFTGNFGWLAHTGSDTLEGRWQMGFSPQEVTTLWMRYAREGLDARLGDLNAEDWTLPVQTSRARGTVVRFQEGPFESEGLWLFPRGTVQLERIPGNNTQGPFRLSRAPLLPGSEEVFLVQEGRRTRLVRGEDYTVDYWIGEVALLRRVLYPEEFIEVRYVAEGEGTGLRAAGLRYASGSFAFGGGAWQIYGPGGFRDAPGGFFELSGALPFTSVRVQAAGEENQGITYGALEQDLTLGPYAGHLSGLWRKGQTPLPGEGPLQIRQRLETQQSFHMGRAVLHGTYLWEEDLQQVRAAEGGLEGPVLSGTWRLSVHLREVQGTSRREGWRVEGTYPAFRFFLARYQGQYPAQGIRPGVWWEGGGSLEAAYGPIRADASLQTVVQGRRHQEDFSASLSLQPVLALQVSGRRTFEGLWLATLSGKARMDADAWGVNLEASRTFQSDRYLLEPSRFWRVGGGGWIRSPLLEIQLGGSLQQGERTTTDTGGVLSRTHQIWGMAQARGRWGVLQTVGTWQRYHTLIPVEGETWNRAAEIRWRREGSWTLTGMSRMALLEGRSTGGYRLTRSARRAEAGSIREGAFLRMGLLGVYADTVVVDTTRFQRAYQGVQMPSGVRWGMIDVEVRPEAGRGYALQEAKQREGWIYRLGIRMTAGGRWGRVWMGVEEEQTSFGVYRFRRVEGGVQVHWHVLRTGGSFLLERDLLRGGENRTLNLQVGGVF